MLHLRFSPATFFFYIIIDLSPISYALNNFYNFKHNKESKRYIFTNNFFFDTSEPSPVRLTLYRQSNFEHKNTIGNWFLCRLKA